MLRNNGELPQMPQSPKRMGGAVPRPRSGCSEQSFNMDTPLTPHFNQTPSTTTLNSTMSEASTGPQRNGKPSPSAAFSFSQSDKNLLNITDSFASFSEQDIYVFTEPLNRKLCCPVCSNVFNIPVITTCGHTFCKSCVEERVNEICPIDHKASKYIVDNIALREQIGELVIHCKYGCKKGPSGGYIVNEEGCPVTVKIADRYNHEKDCDFSIVQCPNNNACKPCLKKDLEAHLKKCNSFTCPNNKYGCNFMDTMQALEQHTAKCPYESMRVGAEGESNYEKIIKENKSAREDIDFMLTSLRGLSQRCETLEAEKEELVQHVDRIGRALEETHQEMAQARQERQMILEELDQLKQRTHTYSSASNYDPDTIIKCKGTCVGHDGPVWCLSVNNEFLFSGSSDNHVKVWDTSSNYKCVRTLEGHSGIVLALTVYGNKLYSGSQDTKIMVWNIDNNFDLEDTLDAHDNPVCTLAASRGMVFSGSLKTVKVWISGTGKHSMRKELTGFNHWVRALSATDKELYCGSYQTIEIYNLDTLEITTALKTYGGSVYSICVTDKHILCGTYEKVIHVWELATMEQVTTLQGHNGTVYALAYMPTPSGILIFSASYDRTIRVWSMSNMICKQTLIRHAGSVACLATSKGRLFSGGIDSLVKAYCSAIANVMNLASVAGEPDRRLVFVSFNQDSSSLAVGTKDGYQLYSLNNADKLELIHRNEVEKEACIVARLFSSSLIAVVSLASPRKLKVCHFKKETEICNYSYSNSILAVKLNRQRLIVCLEESLYVHNIRDMKVIHTIRSISANPNGLCDLSCSNECSYLAYPGSSRSGTVQIFDTITLRSVATIPAHDNPLAALSFNLSGNKIATASEKGTVIRVFSVPDGAKLFEFRRGVKRCVTITSLAFSADSLFLAASSNTETVHVFKLEKKEDRPTEEPHSWTGYVTSAFKSSASYLPTQVTEVFNQFRAFATCRLDQSGLRTICSLTTIQKVLYVLVVSEDGMLHAFTLDPLDGGDCKSIKAHRIDVLESISARRDSNADRPLLSQKKSSPPSAEKTRTKSSSDSPASDSQSYQDVETAGGSPPDALKLDDDSEFPPMSPHDS